MKNGVKRIAAVDQPFDPNLHQGISQEVNPDLDENTIIKEMQPGYTLNDRVLRASDNGIKNKRAILWQKNQIKLSELT